MFRIQSEFQTRMTVSIVFPRKFFSVLLFEHVTTVLSTCIARTNGVTYLYNGFFQAFLKFV